jgi:predicted nucleic acid-binding protein
MGGVLYVDTSAVLRAVLEQGLSPDMERRLSGATYLATSRLSLVEAARALHRVRHTANVGEEALAEAERAIDSLWDRCEILELSRGICDLAQQVAPGKALRSLDALHLATYLHLKQRLADVEILTADERLQAAAEEAD